METFSLIAKAFIAVAGVGSVVTIPTVLSLNVPPQSITISNFPQTNKERYKDNCQLMINDEKNNKYVLVCALEDEGNSPNFYFLSNGQGLVGVKSIKKVDSKEDELELELISDILPITTVKTEKIKASSSEWAHIFGKTLGDCEFTSTRETDIQWKIRCPKNDLSNRDILLTPLVIK